MEGICGGGGQDSTVICFAGHRYAHRGGSEWLGNPCVLYYSYLVSKIQDMLYVIAFAYVGNIRAGCRADALSVKKVGDSKEVNTVENSEKESSENIDERTESSYNLFWRRGALYTNK